MHVLSRRAWQPAALADWHGDSDHYLLLADAEGELAAFDYDCKKLSEAVDDPLLAHTLLQAWNATRLSSRVRVFPSPEAHSAWVAVSNSNSPALTEYLRNYALLMETRTRPRGPNPDAKAQLAELRDNLIVASSLSDSRWWQATMVCARLSISLSELEVSKRLINTILDRESVPAWVVGNAHLVLAELAARADDMHSARSNLIAALGAFDNTSGGISEAHWGLACLAQAAGERELALHEYELGAQAFKHAGEAAIRGEFIERVVEHLLYLRDFEMVERWAHRALTIHHDTNNWEKELNDYALLCRLAQRRGDLGVVANLAASASALRIHLRRLAWNDRDRIDLARTMRRVDLSGIRASIAIGDHWQVVSFLEARRADSMAVMLRHDPLSNAVSGRIEPILRRLQQLETSSRIGHLSHGSLPNDAQTALDEACDELTKEIGSAAADLISSERLDIRKQLDNNLGEGTYLLQFDLFLDEPDASGVEGYVVTTVVSDNRDEPEARIQHLTRHRVAALGLLAKGLTPDQSFTDGQPWPEWLASILIPPSLWNELTAPGAVSDGNICPLLLLSPSARLWGLPYAAMEFSGVKMLDVAAIALTPSLRTCWSGGSGTIPNSLRRHAEPFEVTKRQALCHLTDVGGLDIERASLGSGFDVVDADAQTFMQALYSEHDYDLAVVSCHGNGGVGLAHALFLGEGWTLTAGAMLGMHLPRVLIMGSCWSTSLSFEDEAEPLGLPTIALLRGSTAVIGGSYTLPDGPKQPTARLLADIYAELAGRLPPFEALRIAQLKAITHVPKSDWRSWAGFMCVIRAESEPLQQPALSGEGAVRESRLDSDPDIPTRRRGSVKWFNSEKGFGFISQARGGEDVFVHYSQILSEGYRTLTSGQQVEFSLEPGRLGPTAARVTSVDAWDSNRERQD